MIIKNFKFFENSVDNDPLSQHNLRISKGYKPKYKSGLIGIRFEDAVGNFKDKYRDVDDSGKFKVNYQNIFKYKESLDFINYFEDKYDIKLSDWRSEYDDFYVYFKCTPGSETDKIIEVSRDKVVRVADYVDIRSLETVDKLLDIQYRIEGLVDNYSEDSLEDSNLEIKSIINELKGLL
jgi:hypothetical protein